MAQQQTQGEAAEYYQNQNQNQNQQQQQYAQPRYSQPPNYGYAPPTQDPTGEKLGFNQTFKIENPKWNDLWAGILFLIVCAGFIAVSGIALQGYSATRSSSGGIYGGSTDFGLTSNTMIMFAFVLGMAFILSNAYVWLARAFPKALIWITGVLNIIFGLATAIFMISRKFYSGGIVLLIFSAFTVICFISWIPRIPFSAFMLRTSVDVSKRYGHVYIVSLIGGLLGAAFAAYFSVALVAIYVKWEPGNNPSCTSTSCSSAKVAGLIAFMTFAAYWISEWLKNTIHTTVSGVYGSWYFCSSNFPTGATRGAFKRSVTYSFGSISLGSLIVAVINFLRQICSVAQSSEAAQGNIVGSVLFCILGCFISLLDWAVQFVNRYAFITIALYGKSYFAAARDTWTLIKDRGIDALVNMCLLGPVFSMGSVFVGFASALLGYLYVEFTKPAYNRDGSFTPVIVAFSFLIGTQICNIMTTPLSSGVDTIFVAAAWDPDVLQRDHPDLYSQMLSVYPPLAQAIQV